MDLFVHRQNLLRYAEMLDGETDPGAREELRVLLIDEENRFGVERERLQDLEEVILHSEFRISRQERIVADGAGDNRILAAAQDALAHMRRTRQILKDYRKLLLTRLSSLDQGL